MPLVRRVLDAEERTSLREYATVGGGCGLEFARRLGPLGTIDEIEAAGLRGRGGAGFSTGRKWRTIAENRSSAAPTSVVVNGAEGEPGTFKDRALLRCNPYKILEGAMVAALAVEADEIIICLKASFERELARVRGAIDEIVEAGWASDLRFRVVEGPSSYLFGEETALLEVIEGRQPFPRVDPPFRRGVDRRHADVGHTASRVHLAGMGGTDAAPALVNNVETLANVAGILCNGADWYRTVGTPESPGTLVVTITGDTRRDGVGEVPMGTTLREAIALIGGGPKPGREILGVLSGVANPILPRELLDTPLSFEGMAGVGSGLGAGGFIVFQDRTDMLAVAHGVARYLAIESCGQCEPCKADGLAIAKDLDLARRGAASTRDVADLHRRLDTVTRGARCSLASQQDSVIRSILGLFGVDAQRRTDREDYFAPAAILPLVDIVDRRAILDTSHFEKQSDWTHDARDSGAWPAARLGNTPLVVEPSVIREDPGSSNLAAVAVSLRPTSFSTLLSLYRDLETTLEALRRAEPANRAALWRPLERRLRVHLDVSQRVLYPMVRRVGGSAGDDVTEAAEHLERAALNLLGRLKEADEQMSEADLDELARDVRGHIITERDHVLPLLRGKLDSDQLAELADGLNEARLSYQPAAGERQAS